MNWANHQINAISTFPFYTLEWWEQTPPPTNDLPLKWDTVIWNDVWIGQNTTILPWIYIWDWAIIWANSVVSKDVEPYTIVAWNPVKVIRKRFDNELIELLEKFKWWDKSIDEINSLIPILTSADLESVRNQIKKILNS